MRRAILCGLFALAACRGRTEIVLGVITDLEAPGALNRVHLDVRPLNALPTADPLIAQDWTIPGIPDQPFILPGSFGLYSPDGSEPRVKITLTGFKDPETQPRVTRVAVLSLLSERTLFLRQSLVAGCVNNNDCSLGKNQTCVEGLCLDARQDIHSLPAYRQELIAQVQCGSTAYRNTATHSMMAAAGACGSSSYCQEATCYTAPSTSAGWRAVSGVTNADLYSITAVRDLAMPTPHLFVVGTGGAALHFAPAPVGPLSVSWLPETTGVTQDLYSVWGANTAQVIAVGAAGTIVARDAAGTWTPMTSPTTANLYGLWGAGARDIWAVGGQNGSGVLLHFDGQGWSVAALPPGTPELRGVSGSSSSNMWLVGKAGTILHFDGVRFTPPPSGMPVESLSAVWTSGARVYVTSQAGSLYQSTGGSAFAPVDLGTNANGLRGVFGFPSGDVFVVGNSGTIFHAGPDGRFFPEQSELPLHFAAVAGTSPFDVYAVGRDGALYHDVGVPGPDGGADLALPPDLAPPGCTTVNVSTLVTSGTGDGSAAIAIPRGVAFDGTLLTYVTDQGQFVQTAVSDGTTSLPFVSGGLPVTQHIAYDQNSVYYVTTASHQVVRIAPYMTGYLSSLVVGGGIAGWADGFSDVARFHSPAGIACDGRGMCYVADGFNCAVRAVDVSTSIATTVAGGGGMGICADADGTGGPTGTARMGVLNELAYDARNNAIWVADSMNSKVRLVQLPGGQTTTVFNHAVDMLAADGRGNVFGVQNAMTAPTIVLLSPTGIVTMAGGPAGTVDGNGCAAQFTPPGGMVADPAGHRLWLTEPGPSDVRALTF